MVVGLKNEGQQGLANGAGASLAALYTDYALSLSPLFLSPLSSLLSPSLLLLFLLFLKVRSATWPVT